MQLLPDFLDAVVEASGLKKSSIRQELAGAAPGVCGDVQRSHCVGGRIEHDGVGGAVIG